MVEKDQFCECMRMYAWTTLMFILISINKTPTLQITEANSPEYQINITGKPYEKEVYNEKILTHLFISFQQTIF